MASAFTGDFAKLGLLRANLARLANVPSQIAADASEGIRSEIDAEFSAGHDPYGRDWDPLAEATLSKGRNPPPLTDTGAMRDSLEVRPMPGAGISVSFDVGYVVFHQRGTKVMPRRAPLPYGGFPAAWSEKIRSAQAVRVKETIDGSH